MSGISHAAGWGRGSGAGVGEPEEGASSLFPNQVGLLITVSRQSVNEYSDRSSYWEFSCKHTDRLAVGTHILHSGSRDPNQQGVYFLIRAGIKTVT